MKTKLGISVGLMAALGYFMGLFGGYTTILLFTGYVLLCESDEFLKKATVNMVVIAVSVSVVCAVLNLIPGLIAVIDDACNIFGGDLYIRPLSAFFTFFVSLISYAERLLFLALGCMALKQKTISIPFVDKFVEEHMK